MLDQSVTDETAIHECVDRIPVQLLNFRLRIKAVHAQAARISGSIAILVFLAPPRRRLWKTDARQGQLRSYGNELIENILSKDLINALAVTRHRRRNQHRVGCRMQLE